MSHGEMKRQAITASLLLIDESQTGETSGPAVAEAIGADSGNMSLYHALMAAHTEGYLRCDFPGGMGLPVRITRA
jgi:hypothetical protein